MRFSLRSFPKPFLSFLLVILLISISPRHAWGQKEPELKTITIPDLGTYEYVALGDLAEYLNLRTFYSEKARKVILYVGSSEVKVTAMNPFVQINERMVQMPLETRYEDDDILVPLNQFAGLIRPLYPGTWPETLGAAEPANNHYSANITKILIEDKANGTLVRIQTTKPFSRKHITPRFSKGWMYIDIIGGRVAPGAAEAPKSGSLITRVTPVQAGAVAQLSFQLRQDIDQNRLAVSGQGNEILVSLPTQEIVPSEVLRNLESERQKWRIDTIVLDPGHGGHDPGAIGPDGVREKDITLQVAHRLRKLIQDDLEVRVIMTREKDVYVKLNDRTSMANAAQGKLFISLHCNANKSRRVNGATTYFLGTAKTEEALEVALRENSVIRFDRENADGTTSEQDFILTAMAQNAFHRESEDIASIVQSEMRSVVGLPDRGVHQAGFLVLVGSSMPNILVEMAFISNPKESQLLRSGDVQQKMAQAIFNSIKRFKSKYEWGS